MALPIQTEYANVLGPARTWGSHSMKVPEHQEQPGEEALSQDTGGEAGRVSELEVTLSYSRERPELHKMSLPQ